MNAVMGNQIELLATTLGGGAAGQIAGGKLKGLGVASAKRVAVVPNVPTYAEAGYPFEASSWVGVFAPTGTSPQITGVLNAAIQDVMKDPALQQKLLAIGFDPLNGSQEQADAMFTAEVAKWGTMVKALDITIN
jgi:tripartite-type tricarboxylate transporter receptor subunit TctC